MNGLVNASAPSRDLLRLLRAPPETRERLPESVCWRAYLELRRRGEPQASGHFVAGLRSLHRRRGIGAGTLAVTDPDVDDHKLAHDPYVGELWRSYKRALCANRTGPAGQLLREFEQQLQTR